MIRGTDYIGVGVGAIILNEDGRIFLAKRGAQARNERHKWEFPGGSVEFGETLEDAIVREIREEYGFSISPQILLDVVNHILPDERQHWVSPTFLCHIVSGSPSILEPHKCDDIAWFSLESLPLEHMTTASQRSLQSYRHYLSKTQR